MKPGNGTAIIDLSNLTGYGNEKLPPGTNITILAGKGLFMPTNSTPTVGNASDLSLSMQGWSGTAQPGSNDTSYNVSFPQLNITQLPTISGNPITDNIILIKINPNEVQFEPQISNNQNHVFEQK